MSIAERLSDSCVLSRVCLLLHSLIRWDWRSVMEDEAMYIDAQTGELIHPIHHEMEESESL